MKHILICSDCGAQFCPFCGIALTDSQRHPIMAQSNIEHSKEELRQFNFEVRQEAPVLVKELKRPQRRTPARSASIESEVKVPLLEAIVSGGGLGLTAAFITALCASYFEWSWWIPVLITGLVTTVGAVGIWFILLIDHRKLLVIIEDITGIDLDGLDGDGTKGKPGNSGITRIEVTDRRTELEEGEERKQMQFGDLPVDEETLRNIAIAIFYDKGSFSRSALVEARVISDSACRKLHEAMREAGWARYVDDKPTSGTELTGKGRAILRHFLPPPPNMFGKLEVPDR